MEMPYLNKPRSFVKNFHFCNFAMIIEQELCLTDGLSVKHFDVKNFHGKKGTVLGVQSVEQSVRHSPSFGAKGHFRGHSELTRHVNHPIFSPSLSISSPW